ncbi:MAG TPA: flagellar hook-basal body complex protein, partial [Candidatus Hydrogenedentes bacterium]|nr:flagellar hook-basal body complex protein [Candidatus Hydrogenedentota bacterium]
IPSGVAGFGNEISLPVTPFEFNLDFTDVTELSADSDVSMSNQDGYPRGTLESFNIGEDGTINGVFTNGLTRVLGQVALATFANVGGLSRSGNNTFRDTPASGSPQIGLPNAGGRGQVSGGVLEGSNVDLGTEFSNMIVTQRGFQANARTITAADTLLQETVNLVR